MKKNLPKLPKTVIIGGRDWNVEFDKDKKEGGATFDFVKSEIIIGQKLPLSIPEHFLHEVAEAIMVERGYRFSSHDINNYRFVMNHQEFESFIVDLRLSLKDVLKI